MNEKYVEVLIAQLKEKASDPAWLAEARKPYEQKRVLLQMLKPVIAVKDHGDTLEYSASVGRRTARISRESADSDSWTAVIDCGVRRGTMEEISSYMEAMEKVVDGKLASSMLTDALEDCTAHSGRRGEDLYYVEPDPTVQYRMNGDTWTAVLRRCQQLEQKTA